MPGDDVDKGDNDDRINSLVERALERNGLNSLLLDIHERLGEMRSDLRHVSRRQDEIVDKQTSAETSRAKLHERLNGVSEQVAIIDSTFERIVPLVDKHEAQQQQAEAQLRLMKKVGMLGASTFTALGGSAGLWHYWDEIARFLHLRS